MRPGATRCRCGSARAVRAALTTAALNYVGWVWWKSGSDDDRTVAELKKRAKELGRADQQDPQLLVILEPEVATGKSPRRPPDPTGAIDEPRDVFRRAAASGWPGAGALVAATRTSAREALRWTVS